MKVLWALFLIVGSLCMILGGVAFFRLDSGPDDLAVWVGYQGAAIQPETTSQFTSIESDSEYRLIYQWKDFDLQERESSFSILKSVLKEAEDEYGFFPDELDRYVLDSLKPFRQEMIVHLRQFTNRLIEKSRYADLFSIEDSDWDRFNIKISAPPPISREVKDEFEKVTHAVFKERSKRDKKIERAAQEFKEEFLQTRGLRQMAAIIGIDYTHVAQKNRSRVEGAFESLEKKARGLNLHQFISLVLSFIQQIRYGNPPVSEKGKNILGFWVPPKVLVTNFGDCDCKAVTFASLWLSYKKYPLVLVKIPNHMFIGLAIPSFSGEGFLINGIRYTLCEVTGPGKTPLGIISPYSRMYLEGGNYNYELIK